MLSYRRISAPLLFLMSAISGSLLPLAFAPFNNSFLALISLCILFLTLYQAKHPLQAAALGLCFGFFFFGIGVSWVYISIHTFGNVPVWLASLITIMMIVALAFFPATFAYVSARWFRQNIWYYTLFAMPVLWVIWEWLRSWLFTGFPWLFVGYSQLDTALAGFAPLAGIYGVSFLVALCAGILLLILLHPKYKIKFAGLLLLAIVWLSTAIINHHPWTRFTRRPIDSYLVQGNIPQSIKWDPQLTLNTLDIYMRMTQRIWRIPHHAPQLIIWPEAAIPALLQQVEPYIVKLNDLATTHNSTIITGIPLYSATTKQFFNAMISVGLYHNTYIKRHLVPFGEYMPLKNLLAPLLTFWQIPMSDFSAGSLHQSAFIVNNLRIAPFICYEVAYPRLVLNDAYHSQFLLTITDDSWFGRSIAAAQQLQIGAMRALETGRFELAASNNGITAVINPFGKIIKQLPMDNRSILATRIYAAYGITPLMRIGYTKVLMLLVLWLILPVLLIELRRSAD